MDPTLLQQIIGGGAIAGQQTATDQELADLIARRRAAQARPSITGLGAGLGAIGDLILGRKESDLRAKQAELGQQMNAGTNAFSNAFSGAQQPSQAPQGMSPGQQFATPFSAAPDTSLAPLKDRATDQQDKQQTLAQLRTAGMLSGNPAISGYLKQEPMMDLHQEQMRKLQGENAALESPLAGSAYSTLAKAMGFDLPQGTPPATARGLMPIIEKMFGAKESASARRDSAAMLGDFRRQAQQAREDQALDKRWTQFGQELDPSRGRSGPLGKQLELVAQIDRDLGLIEKNPNPTDQQIYELARGLDRAISGAAPTMGSTEHLVPGTLMGKIRGVQQFISNKPTGADKQAFVAQMAETLQRLKDAGQGNIRQWQGKRASRFSDLARRDQARFEAELQNYGLTPEEFDPQSWAYKGLPAKAAAAAPVGEDTEALAWAKANPTDPRAKTILQLQGAPK